MLFDRFACERPRSPERAAACFFKVRERLPQSLRSLPSEEPDPITLYFLFLILSAIHKSNERAIALYH